MQVVHIYDMHVMHIKFTRWRWALFGDWHAVDDGHDLMHHCLYTERSLGSLIKSVSSLIQVTVCEWFD